LLILADVFPILTFLSLLGALAVFAYLFTTERQAPKFSFLPKVKNDSQARKPKVSIIVTAKNEEEKIASCLKSLLLQSYSSLEILVVDDSSTDKTVAIVSDLLSKNNVLKLISAGLKPEGWVGKSWPCWRGFEESRGEYLLFVDADSVYNSDVVERSVLYMEERSFDMFSLSPKVQMHGIWAHAVLPLISGAINLLYPMKKVNDRKSKRAYVFGTYFLVRKHVYESTGGHSKVRDQLVEDAAVAQLIKSSGYSLRVERGPKLLSTDWETEPKAIFHGLERITSSSIKNFGMASILNAILLFFLVLYPVTFIIAALVSSYVSGIFLAGVIASFLNIVVFLALTSLEIKAVSGKTGPENILYILGGALFIAAIITTSVKVASGKKLYWKGQGYRQGTGHHNESVETIKTENS
jgi:chlorobactene glucosyltransferase